jgi:predicted RNA-binding protein YlqC (UPF0109 family)
MKEVIEVVARALVDQPGAVTVEETSRRGDTVYLELSVGPGDLGKVIGRHGRIANAIRAVARTAAERDGLRAIVDIV